MDHFEAIETRGENHVAGWVTAMDGAKLWVNVHGTGRPVLFVHGWMMSSAFWRRQISLSDRFQVITMDLRGHGKSPSILRGHTLPRYARDIRDVIRALDLRNVVLMGWSMGGCAVMEYWSQFGGDVLDGLGIIESTPWAYSPEPWNTHGLRGNNTSALASFMDSITADRASFTRDFVDRMFVSGQAPNHAASWMYRESMQTTTETATAIYADYVARDHTGTLPTITVPTLAVYGRSRHMCFGPSTGRYVAGSIPNARFLILENSGHLPFYEEPDLFNKGIAHFIEKLL